MMVSSGARLVERKFVVGQSTVKVAQGFKGAASLPVDLRIRGKTQSTSGANCARELLGSGARSVKVSGPRACSASRLERLGPGSGGEKVRREVVQPRIRRGTIEALDCIGDSPVKQSAFPFQETGIDRLPG